jgi:hypothetical protein
MIAAWVALSYVIGIVVFGDALRRPSLAWAAADRQRGWWLTMIVVSSLMSLGVFVAIAYAVGVLPHFQQQAEVHEGFRHDG